MSHEHTQEFEDFLYHYGTPRHSGRYPWGSGKNPQRNRNMYLRARELEKQGMTKTQIAHMWGMSTPQLKAIMQNGLAEVRSANVKRARELVEEKGYSLVKAAEIMGLGPTGESTIRSWLNKEREKRTNLTRDTADLLRDYVDENRYVDITEGANLYLNGVTKDRLKSAVELLKQEGYQELKVQYDQLGTNHKTTMKVLCQDDVTYQELKENKSQIKTIGVDKVFDEDGNITKLGLDGGFKSVDSSRIFVRYNEDGGADKDGTIELRQGVKDISLGGALYAQVRIAVDDKYYMKGMAMYGDVPDGYDIVYNSNKHVGAPMDKVFKPMQTIDGEKGSPIDMENPFGATIKPAEKLTRAQRYYTDENGKKQLSCINIVNEEGDWNEWKPTLASQFLSKQDWKLAQRQLNIAYENQKNEFEDICALTNPTVKRTLLQSFADDCDASAVHLKAAALPRQGSRVILPFTDLKENEIYAPRLDEGQEVVLVRYPYAGTFESPRLRVHNKGTQAEKVINNAMDAVGIHPKAAAQMSGADFDGDTVLVIPVDAKTKIKTRDPLPGLEGFDPKERYPLPDSAPKMKDQTKQTEMGKVSNLITDMQLQGAPDEELERAVRHSMVVIDAQKHHLDYRLSEKVEDIAGLKAKYQQGGASTLISRAKSEAHPDDRKERYHTNPETGEKEWIPTNETRTTAKVVGTGERVNVYTDKQGRKYYFKTDPVTGKKEKTKTYSDGTDLKNEKTEKVTTDSTKMYEAKDAYTLTSGGSKENPGTKMEAVYAEYANSMKAMANAARLEMTRTGRLEYNPQAAKEYHAEVTSLNNKLNEALKNAPRERQAQLAANSEVDARKAANPDMSDERLKKVKSQALSAARKKFGAKATPIDITEKEWEAIQKGAISDAKLSRIFQKADQGIVRQYATPRAAKVVPPAKKQRVLNMRKFGHSTGEIARALGLSDSQVTNILAGKEK